MIALGQILYVLPVVGLTISIFYYAMILRNANRTQRLHLETKQAQLYNNIWNQSMNNPHFQKSYVKFITLNWNNIDEFKDIFPQSPESENNMAYVTIGFFFEGLVPIVKEGLLDIKYLDSTIGYLLKAYWLKQEPLIDEIREYIGVSEHLEDTEYLYNKLLEYEKQN